MNLNVLGRFLNFRLGLGKLRNKIKGFLKTYALEYLDPRQGLESQKRE